MQTPYERNFLKKKKSLNIHIANLVVKRDKINELNAQSTLLHLKLTMLQNITRKSNPPMNKGLLDKKR